MSLADTIPRGRLQLGVLARLATQGPQAFSDLIPALETTTGALSLQLQRLEEMGLVRLERGFLGRKPRTSVVLTPVGHAAYERYLDAALRSVST